MLILLADLEYYFNYPSQEPLKSSSFVDTVHYSYSSTQERENLTQRMICTNGIASIFCQSHFIESITYIFVGCGVTIGMSQIPED